MTNSFFPSACLVAMLAFTQAGTAQTDAGQSDEIAKLRQDVRKLHLELLQQKAEFQQWKMRNLAATLQQVQTERHQLDQQVRANRQEVVELDISMSASPEPQRSELQGLKDQLSGDRSQKLETWLEWAMQRETAISGELQGEGARLSEIQQQIEKINVELAPPGK